MSLEPSIAEINSIRAAIGSAVGVAVPGWMAGALYAAVKDAVLEEAAKVCESKAARWTKDDHRLSAQSCAEAIRSLKGKP